MVGHIQFCTEGKDLGILNLFEKNSIVLVGSQGVLMASSILEMSVAVA